MNTKDLECFLAVCENKSINKAAKNAFISVQGLSRIIKKLEAELGTEIIIRSQQGIELTNQGRILEKHARTIVDHMSSLNLEIEKINLGFCGELNVALSYGVLGFYSPSFVVEFGDSYPDINLQFEEYTDKKVRNALWYGDCDIALTIAPVDDERFDWEQLDEAELFLVVNKSNSLSKKEFATISDLKGQSLVLQNGEFNIHQFIRNECLSVGFEPNVIFNSNGICMCNRLCKENRGVSICMRHTIEDIKGDELVLIPFKDRPYSLKFLMVKRKDTIPTREMEVFEEFIRNWSASRKKTIGIN